MHSIRKITPTSTPPWSTPLYPPLRQISGDLGAPASSDALIERIFAKTIQELQKYKQSAADKKATIAALFRDKKGEDNDLPYLQHVDKEILSRLSRNPLFAKDDYPFLTDHYAILKEDMQSIGAAAKSESLNSEDTSGIDFKQINSFIEEFNGAFPCDVEDKYVPAARQKMREVFSKVWRYDEAGRRGAMRPKTLPRARDFFLHMFQCRHPVVMEEALDYLLRLLENDPFVEISELDLVNLQKGLLNEVKVDQAENLNGPLTLMLIKTYATAIECYLLHSSKGNCPALQQKTKDSLWDGISALKGLVLREPDVKPKKKLFWFIDRIEIAPGEREKAVKKEHEVAAELLNYWIHYAEQAVERIQTDVTILQRSMQRILNVAEAVVELTGLWGVVQGNQSLSSVLEATFGYLQKAFYHLEDRKDWFERVLIFKKVSKVAMNDLESFRSMTTVIKEYKRDESAEHAATDSFVFYGVIGVLEQVCLKSPKPEIQEEALNSMLQYLTVDDRKLQDRVAVALITMINQSANDHLRNTAFIVLKILTSLLPLLPQCRGGVIDRLQKSMRSFPGLRVQQETEQKNRFFFNVIHTLLRRICEVRDEVDLAGQSLLTLVATSSRLEVISEIIPALAEITSLEAGRNVYGHTLYHILAKQRSFRIYALVKENYKEIDINAKDYEKGDTVLHVAATTGCLDCIKELLRLGADPNIMNDEGDTPMHIAAHRGNLIIVPELLEKGTNSTLRNHHLQTPLNCAIASDVVSLVEFMIGKGLLITQLVQGTTPIVYAANMKAEAVLQYLIEQREELSDMEVRAILKMMCQDGITLACSEKFSLFHLKRKAAHDKYRTAFHRFKSMPQPVLLTNPTKIGWEEPKPSPVISAVKENRFQDLCFSLTPPATPTSVDRDGSGNTSLHYLALHPELSERIKELGQTNLINYANYVGLTPLHVAILSGNEQGTKELLKCQPQVNSQDQEGFTPLHYAVLMKNSLLISLLLEKEASLEAKNIYGDTPLHIAAANYEPRYPVDLVHGAGLGLEHQIKGPTASLEIVQALLKAKADPEARDAFGNTPLHHAAVWGTDAIASHFIQQFPEQFWILNQRGQTALEEAVEKGNYLNARAIISNVTKGDLLALHQKKLQKRVKGLPELLAEMDAKDLFAKLLKQNAELANFFGQSPMHWTPLHIAARCGSKNIIDAYVEQGLDLNQVDIFNNTAGHLAVLKGQKEFLEAWLKKGGDPKKSNRDGRTVMHLAAITGNTSIVIHLLPLKNSIYDTDAHGNLPIHLAAKKGSQVVVELLLTQEEQDNAKNPDPPYERPKMLDKKNDDQKTPFFLACGNNRLNMALFFLEKRANRETTDIFGATALHVASQEGFVAVTRELLKHRAHIRCVDNEGEGCLHKAAFKAHEDIVDLLLQEDQAENLNRPESLSIIKMQDYSGETPLHEVTKKNKGEDSASQKKRYNIAKKLIERGADPFKRDNEGNTPFHNMCAHGRLSQVEFVINNQGFYSEKVRDRLHKLNHKGRTPFFAACEAGEREVVKLLIQKGCSSHQADHEGIVPLHAAVVNYDEKMVQLLLDDGADIMKLDPMGRGVLHLVLNDKKEMSDEAYAVFMKLIKEKPALVLIRDKEGSTPLHLASENGHLLAVKTILSYIPGDDAKKREYVYAKRGGKTAAELASSLEICDAILYHPPQLMGSAHPTGRAHDDAGCFECLKRAFLPRKVNPLN